jgi:hypothetical protein
MTTLKSSFIDLVFLLARQEPHLGGFECWVGKAGPSLRLPHGAWTARRGPKARGFGMTTLKGRGEE